MLRSLYSAISGLRNHQVSLDVIGNNIANVNTAGFKAGRVTFKESMAQLLQGASRPPGFQGGTNPVQLGLGMAVGSIDTMMSQGNLQSTGKLTDLAIEGNAYFVYGSGEARYYSRMGALQFDSNGTVVSPTNGFGLQGKTAREDGTYEGQPITDIRIPFGDKSPAKATQEVQFGCNLDSDSEGLGTVMYTQRYLAAAAPATSLTSIFNSTGADIGIQDGDSLTVSANGTTAVYTVVDTITNPLSEATTISDLVTLIDTFLGGLGGATAALQADGSIAVSAVGVDITNFQVTSNRPGGSSGYISRAFSIPATLAAGSTENTDTLRRPAGAADLIASLYDSRGNAIAGATGLEDGATININGGVGGINITPGSFTYTAAGPNASTLQNLLDSIRNTFGLPEFDGTPQNNLSVGMNTGDTDDDNIPDGAIVIRGQKERDFVLTNVSVQATDPDMTNTSAPTRLNANNGFIELQEARDTAKHSTSIVVYDESGAAHTMTTTFTHSGTPGVWLWDIATGGGETITGGNKGRITFGQDGSPSSFTFDDQATQFSFDPMNGSNEVRVSLDVGSPGSFRGITQFRSPSTTAARSQDGYTMGKLQQISIDEFGEISGVFTNGVTKSLAQIYVADFNNPGGLLKMGDSMYRPSLNTGEAVLGVPKVSSPSAIKPGALELSNVELATEFTSMITTQRGFQANARVITSSDEMLQELVQLLR